MRGGRAFELALLADEAPASVFRFAGLARAGYYNGLTFHRVLPNFVIQGGSPGANEYAGDGPFMRDEIGARSHARGHGRHLHARPRHRRRADLHQPARQPAARSRLHGVRRGHVRHGRGRRRARRATSSTVSRFSQRLPPHAERNAISQARCDASARRAAYAIVDLTDCRTRPARASPIPPDLLAPLADARRRCATSRSRSACRRRAQAVAADYARRGAAVDPGARRADGQHQRGVRAGCSSCCAIRATRARAAAELSAVRAPDAARRRARRAVRPRVSRPLGDRLRRRSRTAPARRARACWSCRRTTRPARTSSARELERLAAICRDRGWALDRRRGVRRLSRSTQPAPVTDLAAQRATC